MPNTDKKPTNKYDEFIPKTKTEMWDSLMAHYPEEGSGKISWFNACNSIEEFRQTPFVKATDGSAIIIGCLLATIGKMCRNVDDTDTIASLRAKISELEGKLPEPEILCTYCNVMTQSCYLDENNVCFDCLKKEDEYDKECDEMEEEEIHRQNNPQYYEN